MPSPTEITCSQLSRLIGASDSPVLIDVRTDEDFHNDPRIIPTSIKASYLDINSITVKLSIDSKTVIVCQEGKKLSQGVAAILREKGISSEILEGGYTAWLNTNGPLVPVAKIPEPNLEGRTVWVTRHRPKIDRIACPWLIRRFIDPEALFLFVAPSEVMGVAEKFNATPFDIEDVFWSHRGETCTFDVMVEEFSLNIDALKVLALIVRGADTNRHDLAPEASGLLAASLGLSRMHKDDLMQLQAGMSLYDAFYHWARDAKDEGHTWPAALNKK